MFFNQNEIKVSFDRERYHTNGKEVICTMKYKVRVPMMSCYEKQTDGSIIECSTYFDLGKHIAVGKAICNEEDQFDKELGRKIAAARAEAKAYEHAKKLVQKYVMDAIYKYNDMVLAFEAKADYIKRHDVEYANSLGE